MNFSDYLRQLFKSILDSIARLMNRAGLTPNSVTLIALLGNFIAAILISLGWIQIGGFLVLLMGPLDAVDGTMARLRNQVSPFGAFLDSISDRYSELMVLGGLLIYYTRMADWRLCLFGIRCSGGISDGFLYTGKGGRTWFFCKNWFIDQGGAILGYGTQFDS